MTPSHAGSPTPAGPNEAAAKPTSGSTPTAPAGQPRGRFDALVAAVPGADGPLGLGLAGIVKPFVPQLDAHECLEAAWEEGLRYFDTAPMYGSGASELVAGPFLAGKPRHEYVLSTKVGRLVRPDIAHAAGLAQGWIYDFSADGVRRSLDESLTRLGVDRLDVALIHDPDDFMDQALAQAWPVLEDWRSQGIIQAAGFGMQLSGLLTRAVREADIDVVLCAGRYTLLDTDGMDQLLPACLERGVAVLVAEAMHGGLIEGQRMPQFNYRPVAPPVRERVAGIHQVCRSFGVPTPAVALRFALSHPAVRTVLTGPENATQLRQNLEWCRAEIPVELWDELRRRGLLRPDAPTPTGPSLAERLAAPAAGARQALAAQAAPAAPAAQVAQSAQGAQVTQATGDIPIVDAPSGGTCCGASTPGGAAGQVAAAERGPATAVPASAAGIGRAGVSSDSVGTTSISPAAASRGSVTSAMMHDMESTSAGAQAAAAHPSIRLASAAPATGPSHRRARAVILCGSGRYEDRWHDTVATGQQVARILGDLGVDCELRGHALAVLTALEAPGPGVWDLVIVNSSNGRIDPEFDGDDAAWRPAWAGLERWVTAGGPVLGLHSATLTWADNARWAQILGGHWEQGVTMHPERALDPIHVVDGASPIVEGLADFEIDDERYSYLSVAADVTPYLTHRHDGHEHPLAWAREVGDAPARVVYNALGHAPECYDHPARQELLRREAAWALGWL